MFFAKRTPLVLTSFPPIPFKPFFFKAIPPLHGYMLMNWDIILHGDQAYKWAVFTVGETGRSTFDS